MRGRLILLVGLLPWLSGCAWLQPARKPGWMPHLPLGAPAGDLVTLDMAILERPLGDAFLNKELWTSTDEMIVPLERKSTINANGFRVGQVVGLTPGDLQTLLKSERYCVNPRRRVVASGTRLTQILGPEAAQASFMLHEGRQATPITLDQARFCLEIVPTVTKDNCVKLEITPKAETGERMLPFQPDVERSSWTLRVDKPHRTFAGVGWEVTLEPNKMLIIGAALDDPETLGFQTFTQEEGPRVQRLLVLRATAAQRTASSLEPALEELWRTSSSPPLALQAALTGK